MAITTNSVSPRFQWGVILAGTFLALAVSIVLLQFGAAIGLADDEPLRKGNYTSWGVVVVGIWILWVQLLASLAGGYTAGYLRTPTAEYQPHENETHDGLYGLTVWALATILAFIAASIAAAVAKFIDLQAGTYEAASAMSSNEQTAAIIFAFSMGAVSLLSAVASWWAATVGGAHRRTGTDFSRYLSFK